MAKVLHVSDIRCIFASLLGTNLLTKEFGKVVEWSITAVLKTAVLRGTGGSNPSLSAINAENQQIAKQTPKFTPKNVKLSVLLFPQIPKISLCVWRTHGNKPALNPSYD